MEKSFGYPKNLGKFALLRERDRGEMGGRRGWSGKEAGRNEMGWRITEGDDGERGEIGRFEGDNEERVYLFNEVCWY